jgi:hypothetical protein
LRLLKRVVTNVSGVSFLAEAARALFEVSKGRELAEATARPLTVVLIKVRRSIAWPHSQELRKDLGDMPYPYHSQTKVPT